MNWKDIDLATWRLVFTAALYLAFAAGCQSQATVAETSESDAPAAAHVSTEDGTGSATEQETGTADQHQKSTTETSDRPEGIVDHAKQMFGQATDSGTQSAKQAGRWVSDQFRGAAGATQQMTGDSMEWADATYQALKAQGLTTAESTSAWLVEDWNNMEAWTYQVKTVEGLSDEELEALLNDWGQQGWECFDVQGPRMMFKKRRESYLRRLPFRDLIRLAPLMRSANE